MSIGENICFSRLDRFDIVVYAIDIILYVASKLVTYAPRPMATPVRVSRRTLVSIDSSELCNFSRFLVHYRFLCRFFLGSPSSSPFWLLLPSFFLELVAMLHSLSSRDTHVTSTFGIDIAYQTLAAASLKALTL